MYRIMVMGTIGVGSMLMMIMELPVQTKVPARGVSNKKVIFNHRHVKESITEPEAWNRLSKKYVLAKDKDKAEVLEQLRVLRLQGIENGDEQGPRFTFPSRAKALFVFDDELKQVCLTRGHKYISPSAKKCNQIDAVIDVAEALLVRGQFDSLRESNYLLEGVCASYQQAIRSVKELCLLIECTRSSLNILGTPRGVISGHIRLTLDGKKIYDCSVGGWGGMSMPVEAEEGKGITKITRDPDVDTKFVLVVEKRAVFQALVQLDYPTKYGCILITPGGKPDVLTRLVLSKITEHLQLPIYCLVDCNPHGLQIFTTFKYGSQNLAFDNLGLTCPDIKLIGLFSEDLTRVNSSLLQELSDDDKKALKGLIGKNYMYEDQALQDQIELMDADGIKAQIEALQDERGHRAIEDYVNEKIFPEDMDTTD